MFVTRGSFYGSFSLFRISFISPCSFSFYIKVFLTLASNPDRYPTDSKVSETSYMVSQINSSFLSVLEKTGGTSGVFENSTFRAEVRTSPFIQKDADFSTSSINFFLVIRNVSTPIELELFFSQVLLFLTVSYPFLPAC